MKNKIIEQIEQDQLKQDVPEFGPGDTWSFRCALLKAVESVSRLLKGLSSVAVIAASIQPSPCERCHMA